jgi:hypothetical protein
MKIDNERKAGILSSVGLFGIVVMIIADICKILPWQLMTDIIGGVFIASLGIGCFMMCYAYRNNTEIGAIPMICGSFGLIGLHCLVSIIDWAMVKLFGISILIIAPWYAFPLLMLFFYGLFRLIANAVKVSLERS